MHSLSFFFHPVCFPKVLAVAVASSRFLFLRFCTDPGQIEREMAFLRGGHGRMKGLLQTEPPQDA